MTDLHWKTITDLSADIRSKAISPVEVTKAYLDRINRLNSDLDAYITVYPEQALAEAKEAEAAVQSGELRGPLHGIPIGIKDLFIVKGMARTCGSQLIQEEPGEADAPSVGALRDAGAIVLGMTNLHEFAFGPTGINPHVGTAKNPWDTTKVCGGSSSGSGSAVAGGLCAGAMGTDTGGSVRLPSALCGIVGLKPTHLRVSQEGIYPLVGEFDTGGPMARSVEDIALMMAALDPDRGFGGHATREALDGLRIGVLEAFFADGVDPDVKECTLKAIGVLEGLGTVVEPLNLPFADRTLHAWNTITLGRVYALHGGRAEAEDSKLAPDVRDRVLIGRDISPSEIDAALKIRAEVQNDLKELMKDYAAFVLPTVPIPAVRVSDGRGELDGKPVDGAKVLGQLTRFASFTGQPAISVPSGLTADGLPVGFQLIGDWNRDEDLLEIAGAYEAASDWNGRHAEC